MKKSDNIFIAGHNGLVGSSILNLLKTILILKIMFLLLITKA